MTSAETIKGKAILRDPRVSMCWDDERPPFQFVTVTGAVTVERDPDILRPWATRIAQRYMGPALADQYGQRNGVAPELVVRLRPLRVVAKVNVAD